MTPIETFRNTPDNIKGFFDYSQTDSGKAFIAAVQEKVLRLIPTGADQSNHACIFRSGVASGAGAVLQFILDLDPEVQLQDAQKRLAELSIRTPRELPSRIASREAKK